MREQKQSPEPDQERLLTFTLLAKRWSCSRQTAATRAREIGLPLIHWNRRVICTRLSDVLRAELEATKRRGNNRQKADALEEHDAQEALANA